MKAKYQKKESKQNYHGSLVLSEMETQIVKSNEMIR